MLPVLAAKGQAIHSSAYLRAFASVKARVTEVGDE